MLVAVGTWELHLPECHSLKEKRGILKPLTSRLGKTLNVSVAETAHQDRWQRAEVADRRVAEQTIRAADQVIESADGVRIIDSVTVYQ